MRILILSLFVLIIAGSCTEKTSVEVLATTSWTAAFAEASGAVNVETLAPNSMLHPSEYEIQISDIQKIKNAKFIIYAGYEVMMEELFSIVDTTKQTLIKINTGYSFEKLNSSINSIARELKTEDIAQKNLKKLITKIDSFKVLVKQLPQNKIQVCCHFFQQDIVEAAGFEVLKVFGPQPMEAYDFKTLNDSTIDFIVDNIHNPIAAPLQEILNVKRIELINFPGVKETKSLEDVILYNLDEL